MPLIWILWRRGWELQFANSFHTNNSKHILILPHKETFALTACCIAKKQPLLFSRLLVHKAILLKGHTQGVSCPWKFLGMWVFGGVFPLYRDKNPAQRILFIILILFLLNLINLNFSSRHRVKGDVYSKLMT